MTKALSLRMRLTLIILCPLLLISTVIGLWQLDTARRTAAGVFDRSLLSAALAVSNDVTLSGGDALSARTREILADTSGGLVYYHVYAPDGVIVAGYATPPVGIPRPSSEATVPYHFEGRYFGREVIGVRLQNRAQIDGFSGVFTTTVWQNATLRDAFVAQLVNRSLVTISALIGSVALVVWFGVRLGLRPLLDLQEAIEQRSSDELSPIRRAVPAEVTGIVGTLNRLFGQVSRSFAAQSEFISNATHQLRNPIAGVLSLAEAVHRAPDLVEARKRATDLLEAARETADLTDKLLTLERAKAISPTAFHERIELGERLQEWLPAFRASVPPGVALTLRQNADRVRATGDATMLREALANLVDNAVRHGGPALSEVVISVDRPAPHAVGLSVADNGQGIAPADIARATERFAQLSPREGSGLGLSIVAAIATAHGGALEIEPLPRGLRVTMRLPACAAEGVRKAG
ncbi:MAG: sensor histidine kinase [Pseudomonadota bacterium]